MVRKKRTPEESARREKILSMYAKCMTTGDIEAHIQDIYGIEVSDSTVSRDYRQDIARCPVVAAAALGGDLRRGISGRNPLPRP